MVFRGRDDRVSAPRAEAAREAPVSVRLSEGRGRWVLLATVLGSSVAMLDATVVNVALPRLADDLGASMSGLQWTVNGYMLTLAGFILLGGSLGDRIGRRRVFVLGVVWFAAASLLCGVAAAVGPFLGGWLVDAAGWRWVFLLNVPLAAIVVLVAVRHVPETYDSEAEGRFDIGGTSLAALALAGVTYALTEAPAGRTPLAVSLAIGFGGVCCGAAFFRVERR